MMMNRLRVLLAAFAAFFIAGSAAAQTAGTVTNHAFAIGKGAGQSGFTSLLCASTQIAIGQSAANPACYALTGDVTMNASGVTAIGAGKVTNTMLAGSIAASKLVGTDIATVGTITSGTWQATPVAVAYGGTGATTAANARANLGVAIGSNVQAWDADLDCLAALSTSGIAARTGSGSCATRTVTAPAAGITVSNGDGVAGNPTLALANDLAALEGLSGTGFAVRTGADAWAQRTITGTTNEIAVSNGDGVSGNPTLSLPSALTFAGKTVTGGTFASPQINSPTGIVKGDVGLGNVDNTSDATKNAATATLTNKTLDCASNTCTVRLPNDVTGALQAANFPALTGDVTTSAGSLATSIGAGKVTSSMLNADVYSTAHTWSAVQTFNSPVINTPTGIVKGDVGLGNVDNTSDAAKNAAAVTLANKTVAAPILTGMVELQGTIKRTGIATPAQITSDQNDYNPSSSVCVSDTLMLSSNASRNITGLAGGVSGCEVLLVNTGSNPIILKDSDAGSTASNRFSFGGDITLAANQTARLFYQAGSVNKWRNTGGSGSGSGGGGSGTVTSVSPGNGMNFSTITTSGQVNVAFYRFFMLGGM